MTIDQPRLVVEFEQAEFLRYARRQTDRQTHRHVTRKIKDDLESEEETNDWKFAAMVVDRLCFWIFSLYLVGATIAIFTAPSLHKVTP